MAKGEVQQLPVPLPSSSSSAPTALPTSTSLSPPSLPSGMTAVSTGSAPPLGGASPADTTDAGGAKDQAPSRAPASSSTHTYLPSRMDSVVIGSFGYEQPQKLVAKPLSTASLTVVTPPADGVKIKTPQRWASDSPKAAGTSIIIQTANSKDTTPATFKRQDKGKMLAEIPIQEIPPTSSDPVAKAAEPTVSSAQDLESSAYSSLQSQPPIQNTRYLPRKVRRARSASQPPSGRFSNGEFAEIGTLKRVSRRDASGKEVLVGTPISEGHANYMLMYDMLTGIRVSVSRCNAKPMRELDDADFTAAHKLAFDVTGNELTPKALYDFKFKDYSPWVFRMIRDIFHVDANEYLMSLTGKYVLSELGSPGKSGSFFYFSRDYRFIIKTIHKSEHKFVRTILRPYFEHVQNNPQTLLSRIFGLHRVKLPGNKKIHFVVMGNVFPSHRDVHETYDLKGSTVGRIVKEEELRENPGAVLKDLNWVNNKRKLHLGPSKREMLLTQVKIDVEFLKSQGIMDYSLLVGCHDLNTGNEQNIRDHTLAVFEPNLENIHHMGAGTLHRRQMTYPPSSPQLSEGEDPSSPIGRTAASPVPNRLSLGRSRSVASSIGRDSHFMAAAPIGGTPMSHSADDLVVPASSERGKAAEFKRILKSVDPVWLGPSRTELPNDAPPERTFSAWYREMGGLRATNGLDEPGSEVYYLGIIDIFTKYDGIKRAEHFWKSLFYNGKKISSVNPNFYGKRFLDFVEAAIARATDAPMAPINPKTEAELETGVKKEEVPL